MNEKFMSATVREVLQNPTMSREWFFLPPDKNKWTLDTIGKFSLDARDFPPDSNAYLPEEVDKYGWVELLSGDDIQSIVEVAKQELENPTIEELFKSLLFYYEYDAFREYEDY